MGREADEPWKEALRSYVLEHGDGLDFTKYFWKGCEPSENDQVQYKKFCVTQGLVDRGYKNWEIAERVKASKSTVFTWRHLTQLPKLAHYLNSYLRLGAPTDGRLWLTTECSHGYGVPIGMFVQVPSEAKSWQDVTKVLTQLPDLRDSHSEFAKEYLFGFLLGIMMGDAAKSRASEGFSHRHIGLVLSHKYETNVLIGDFTSLCAQAVGLRMHRTADLSPSNKPNAFYEWVSQASPLIDWLFNVALGLTDDELTTYDPVRADWMLLAPRDFRVGLIQGIAESDGSVAVSSQVVEFWIDPHRDLFKRILALEGLRAFNSRQALCLSKTQAVKSFEVPIFNPFLKTIRYRRHEIMATARRLARKERVPEDIREEIAALSSSGLSMPEIIERIAETRRVLVSFETGQRWARRGESVKRGAQREDEGVGHR